MEKKNRFSILQNIGGRQYSLRTFAKLPQIKMITGSKCQLIFTPSKLALSLSRLFGLLVNDIVLTHDEVLGLMQNLLIFKKPPKGSSTVGAKYSSELQRHY